MNKPTLHFFKDGCEAQDALDNTVKLLGGAIDKNIATGALAALETKAAIIELCPLGSRSRAIRKVGESLWQVDELKDREKAEEAKFPLVVFYAEKDVTPADQAPETFAAVIKRMEAILKTHNSEAGVAIMNIIFHEDGKVNSVLLSVKEFLAGDFEPARPPTV